MKTKMIIGAAALVLISSSMMILGTVYAENGGSTSNRIPFVTGERLSYEGKFSKIVRGITVADLSFEMNSDEAGMNQISMEAKSKGTVLRLFRFSFLQRYQSEFEDSLRVRRTTKFDQQRDRIRESEAKFDYDSGKVVYTEVDPKDPLKAPKTIASDFSGEVHDLLTGIYLLRTLPLAVGSSFEVAISDSGLVYTVPVKVTKREMQTTSIGRVMCFRVEPQVFGEDRLIEQKGEMVIWITDDARRIPVRSMIKADIGQIDIRLKTFVAGTRRQATEAN
jgi:hypothetical protein